MAPAKRETVVHKFGGAALADAHAIGRVAHLLHAESATHERVIVCSALQGVTDTLLDAIGLAVDGDITGALDVATELRERHLTVAAEVIGNAPPNSRPSPRDAIETLAVELRSTLKMLASETTRGDALRDAALASGERMASHLVSASLEMHGLSASIVDGAALVMTDDRHGDASPDLVRSTDAVRSVLVPLLQKHRMAVVPGFIGRAEDGSTTTMGRGGSDLTATVLAHALDAKEVILWKDVPGCMTADPRIVSDARVVPVLDAREASELAYYGAKVLHPRTLLPLTPGTVLRIRPFASPSAAGTRIVAGRPARGAPVRAISGIARQAMLSVNGTGMLGVPGIAARVFGALAAESVSVSLISQASSEQSICFTVPADRAAQVSDMLRAEFATELARGAVEEIVAQTAMTTIAVVGSGMARTPGVAARIFEAVAHADVSVAAIAQGSSERNISFVVNEKDAAAAMVAVHTAFHLGKIGGGRSARRVQHNDLILLGAGRVARGMISQLLALRQHDRTTARIVGVIDHTGYVFSPRGITPRSLAGLIVHKNHGGHLSGLSGGRKGTAEDAMAHMMSHALVRPIVVDVASGHTGAALELALRHGADLVLANKVPLAAPHADVKRLLHEARTRGRRILHEATVGAGLPVIDTLQQLHASGDRIDSVECSPSGTMGFLFSEMGRGRRFSEAVREARRRGYTEPDPRDDLSGLDVARKGLILARMLGYGGELADVELESLVPDSLQSGSADDFMASLAQVDEAWEARTNAARERGEVLRYRARATRRGVRVGLASVPGGHPLAALDGTDNLFIFSTARYRNRPLVVSGPGAGVEVTAAGVLGDVLRLTTP